ncbi:zinc finger protein 317 [Drosophila ficusphila]|uniref:zinc finger protein 317 n=1 Tax=Drosophila ficusphila TaxID=30025 RepID=UPI0007E89938|nr:zinc finger protein 317 [Drosophila ficusphila]
MTSADDRISVDLEPATLLSVKEENGIVTRVYIAPCSRPRTKKAQAFPEETTLLFHCSYCGNGIRTAGAFKVHLLACQRRSERMRESGIVMPQLRCNVCNKNFASVESLVSHRLRHSYFQTKQKCAVCDVSFDTEPEYRAHLESHLRSKKNRGSNSSVTKIFNCFFCQKPFLASFQPGQVTRRYGCDDCIQKLKTKEAEKEETKPVNRKPDYMCDRCGRRYKYEGFLNRHLNGCKGAPKLHGIRKAKNKKDS